MEEKVAEELASIKARLELIVREHPQCREQIHVVSERCAMVEASAKSAHHRIDEFKRDVCWAIGISVTAAGVASAVIASIVNWALGGE